jgi:SH3-like domain-containing protein
MNWKAVFVVLILGALAWSRPADAEKVKTNQSTKLYSRAGEQSPVILKLKPGQSMTVLAKDGRWLKVRVSGRTGWIPRSKVDMPTDDDEIARNTRRRPFVDGRGTKRGFNGEGGPEDRVGADATGAADDADDKPAKVASRAKDKSKDEDDEDARPAKGKKAGKADKDDKDDKDDGDSGGGDDAKEAARPMAHVAKSTPIYNDPDTGSDASFTAGPKTVLYVVEEKGKWTFVENEEGDAGYVLTSKLDVETPAGGGPRSRAIGLGARIGYAQVNQSVSTAGGTMPVPDNYTAGSAAVALSLGGNVLYPYSRRYWFGGELGYDYERTLFGGIKNMATTSGFVFHNFNLRGSFGYDLQNRFGMIVFGRLGYHYDSFQIDDVSDFTKNTARIPNQIISGPTIGAALSVPRLTSSVGLRASLDTMLFGGSLQQTKNLEDGTGPSAKAFFLGTGVTIHWKPKMDLQGNVDVGFTSLSFSGAPPATSMRGHTGTGIPSGSDFTLAATFGIVYSL